MTFLALLSHGSRCTPHAAHAPVTVHRYTTEYGNVLERTTKYKAVLAGSIELDITSDEADFDAEMGKLALNGTRLSTQVRMATYDAMSAQFSGAPSAAATGVASELSSAPACGPGHSTSRMPADEVLAEEDQEVLQEHEALGRIHALVERMQEMEHWFAGVKSEAEHERKMREMTLSRLVLMQERVERSNSEVASLRAQNAELRLRLEELTVAQEEAQEMRAAGVSLKPTLLATSMKDMRHQPELASRLPL